MRQRVPLPKRNIPTQARQSIERIVAVYRPDKVILFGSYSRGKAKTDSDIDVLVIKQRPKEHRLVDRIGRILEIVPFGTPIEPLVLTPSEVEARLQAGDFFIQEILASGTILYEKPS